MDNNIYKYYLHQQTLLYDNINIEYRLVKRKKIIQNLEFIIRNINYTKNIFF